MWCSEFKLQTMPGFEEKLVPSLVHSLSKMLLAKNQTSVLAIEPRTGHPESTSGLVACRVPYYLFATSILNSHSTSTIPHHLQELGSARDRSRRIVDPFSRSMRVERTHGIPSTFLFLDEAVRSEQIMPRRPSGSVTAISGQKS